MADGRRVEVRGDVVLRPAKPWTPTVHALLAHLQAAGLPVPEPLGVADGVETVRLLPGDGGEAAWPHQTRIDGVRSAGALLRAVHDATHGWTPPADATWAVPFGPGPVVCHGDVKPGNLAWRDGRAVGLFDWDVARPGEGVDDVAYALWWFAPFDADAAELRHRRLPEDVDAAGRVEAFLDGYGWTGPLDVLHAVTRRRTRAVDEVEWLGARGHEPCATWVRDGLPAVWRRDFPRLAGSASSPSPGDPARGL